MFNRSVKVFAGLGDSQFDVPLERKPKWVNARMRNEKPARLPLEMPKTHGREVLRKQHWQEKRTKERQRRGLKGTFGGQLYAKIAKIKTAQA